MPLKNSFVGLILANAVAPIGVRIIRGFGDPVSVPTNYNRYWMISTISDLSVGRRVLTINLVTAESALTKTILPRVINSRQCNHELYGLNCGVVKASFTFSFTVLEVLNSGTRLRVTPDNTSTSKYNFPDIDGDIFGDPPVQQTAGHYSFGDAKNLNDATGLPVMILRHDYVSGTECFFDLHMPISGITATAPNNRIAASWGCDLRIAETCIPKFNNKARALAMPNIPSSNPVTHVSFNIK